MTILTIPDFTLDGILPEGVHTCNLNDIKRVFTSIPLIDLRVSLFSKLEEYIKDLKGSSITCEGLLIDGSYITTKLDPSDIDIAVILNVNFNNCDANQFDLRLITGEFVKEYYGFSMFPVYNDSASLDSVSEFYQQQEPPNENILKGILRVSI